MGTLGQLLPDYLCGRPLQHGAVSVRITGTQESEHWSIIFHRRSPKAQRFSHRIARHKVGQQESLCHAALPKYAKQEWAPVNVNMYHLGSSSQLHSDFLIGMLDTTLDNLGQCSFGRVWRITGVYENDYQRKPHKPNMEIFSTSYSPSAKIILVVHTKFQGKRTLQRFSKITNPQGMKPKLQIHNDFLTWE